MIGSTYNVHYFVCCRFYAFVCVEQVSELSLTFDCKGIWTSVKVVSQINFRCYVLLVCK